MGDSGEEGGREGMKEGGVREREGRREKVRMEGRRGVRRDLSIYCIIVHTQVPHIS